MSKYFDRQYKKHGLEKIQRQLLAGIRPALNEGATLLDIGCGVGALHLALLTEGAVTAVGVEISEGMLEKARRHAAELGVEKRTVYFQGDFVDREKAIDAADITMMDKVICCYPDVGTLVDSSIRKTKHILAITHPQNNFLAAGLFKIHITAARLLRLSFHPFWHDWERVHTTILSRGFELIHADSTPVWQARVYRRVAAGPSGGAGLGRNSAP